MFPTVFLDKDGTLIPDVPYNVDPALIELSPGAAEGLKRLHAVGYQLIVVSNQSGVARGYFPETALVPVVQKLRSLFQSVGVPLAGFYYCPHYPTGEVAAYAIACSCRKPEPGLLLQAAQECQVDLARSWMVGDILNDVEAGRRAGCRTILIDNGNETEWLLSPMREPHYRATDLTDAAEKIIHTLATPSPIHASNLRL
jgi:D-glycero-D-manno-heptose 1,7-bisphosphate phosphatase